MSDDKEFLTKDKYEELAKELDYFTHVKRKEVAEKLEYSKSLGDLSENAEYHEARDEQAQVEYRISQLENLLKNAEILNHKQSDVIEAGSVVTIQKTSKKNDQKTYELVGSEEADTLGGKLSYSSPLGTILLGKKKGEEFTFVTPKGDVKYKIIDVK
jgi:transcription elongation factor GreA